jgi:hypothetical protein
VNTVGVCGCRRHHRAAAPAHAFECRERHQQRVGAGKSHDLAGDRLVGLDHDPGTDRHLVDRPATSTTRPRTPIARPSGRLTPVFASYGRALPRLRLHPGYKKILHGRRALHARIFFIATAPSWQKQRTRIDSVAVIARWFLTSCLPASLIIASPLWDFRGPSPDWTVGQSLLNRLRPNLNVEHEMTLGKKTNPVQYLRAIRLSLPRGRARVGLGFVNHALLRFRLGLSQSVLEGRRCGVPTCARSGEEGDWHARIAD